MHLKPDQAMQYLRDIGYPMAKVTWFRWKRILNKNKRERLYEIARVGYEEEHTDSIEEIETARKLLWKEYKNAVKPTDRATILEKIINTRPLLSSYYDATKEVIQKPAISKDNISTDIQTPTTESESWSVPE
jgi:hypothetical protein